MDKAHEDSILEEARIIEAKHKRIAELSVGALLLEYHRKSHWDFVLWKSLNGDNKSSWSLSAG